LVVRRPFGEAGRLWGAANLVLFASAVPLGVAFEPIVYVFIASIAGSCTSIVSAMLLGSQRAAAPVLVVMRRSFEVLREAERDAEGYRDASDPEVTQIRLDGREVKQLARDVRIYRRESTSPGHPAPRVLYVVFDDFVVQVAAALDDVVIHELHHLLRVALQLPKARVGQRIERPQLAAFFSLLLLVLLQCGAVFGVSFYAFYVAERSFRGDVAGQFGVLLVGSVIAVGATFAFTAIIASVLRESVQERVRASFGLDASPSAT
jgi:hypothetical protein